MKKAILKTLVYSDIFNFPLKKQEIWDALIWEKKTLPKFSDFEKELESLKKTRKIKSDKGFFFVFNNKKAIALRKKREKYSKEKLKVAKKTGFWLKAVPTIKMVAITGSLAVLNSEKQDDIDFLIVSSENKLWITRALATLAIELVAKRRRPNQVEIKDKICLNMFLDEKALKFQKQRRDLFSAHEISQVALLWERNNCFKKFKKNNLWVKDYLPNWKS
ncbi:MAG: hypothetical protein ABIH88_01375 [Patescibacteria group bacterium]